MTATPPAQRPGGRNIAPIRWPHPTPHTIALMALWVLGVLVAVLVPALIVHPSAVSPASSRVLTAFSTTVVGAVVMAAVGTALYRRHREPGLLVFTLIPTGAVLAGGFMLLGLKLFT